MAIAVGLAFMAMLLTLLYVTSYRHSVQHQQQSVQVYVAAHNINAGTTGAEIVRSHALKTESITRSSVVPGAIANPDEVANLVLTQPVYAGEQVTLRRFTDVQSEGIVGQLKGTMRAVQVPGDANQLLAGTLKTGDQVDVVANLTSDTSSSAHLVKIVLRDITVLQTNGASLSSTASSNGQQDSVILAVTDTQVQRLFYVMKNADWTLELRPATDAVDSGERVESVNTILTEGSR
ncbi:MAG TPA: Flp pilus assembly protein CpaB [Gaiellaceae bacterium]